MRAGAVLAIAGVFVACSSSEDRKATDEAAAPIEGETVENSSSSGGVNVHVALTPKEPRLGDPLELLLTVDHPVDLSVEMPAFGEALGRFAVVQHFVPRRAVEGDRVVESQEYRLQASRSGRVRIPALRVEWQDKDGELRELFTEEIPVTVAPIEDAELGGLRTGPGKLDVATPGFLVRYWWVFALVLAAFMIVVAVLLWRRQVEITVRKTAFERAAARLSALEAAGLPEADEVDAWYVELSAIVRSYIEDRFGLRAPELTSEEFLREARQSPELTDSHRALLSNFLSRADRVKFAGYRPDADESRAAIENARRFLGETRLSDGTAFVPDTGEERAS